MQCPKCIGDRIGIQRAIITERLQIVCKTPADNIAVNHTSDNDVGNMDTLRSVLTRERLSEISKACLGHGKMREVRATPKGCRGTRKEARTFALVGYKWQCEAGG